MLPKLKKAIAAIKCAWPTRYWMTKWIKAQTLLLHSDPLQVNCQSLHILQATESK
jgi:hypothetical protein